MKYQNKIKNLKFLPLLLFFISCSQNSFGGFGIQVPNSDKIVSDENPYVILDVFSGAAGMKHGLQKGDVILSVDNAKLNGKQESYIVKNILRGKIDSFARLEILRDGEIIVYNISREKITLQD